MECVVENEPLISVVIPAFNCQAFVEEAVQSIQLQTYRNLEILICDDNSNDDTFLIVKRIAENDKRIKLFRNSSNQGAAFSRNLLIRKSKGVFIVLHDADDVCDSMRIEDQLNFLNQRQLCGCGTFYNRIDLTGRIVEKHSCFENYALIFWSAFQSLSFCNASLMIKRNKLIEVGLYKEKLRTEGEDHDLIYRLLINGCKIETLDKYHYRYRLNPQSVSLNNRENQRDNSIVSSEILFKKYLKDSYSDEFVSFMKNYHTGNVSLAGIEYKRFYSQLRLLFSELMKQDLRKETGASMKLVRFRVAQIKWYLALNYIRVNFFVGLKLLLQTLLFCPQILKIYIR